MNGTKSKWSDVESGVPQGTVLDPVLFSLHINDIPVLDNVSSDIRLFADDCVCFRVNKGNNKITELRTILQRESQNS